MAKTGRPVALRPLGYDPFTGERVEFKSTKQGGVHVAATKKYFFGPFKTKGELLVAFSTRDGMAPKFTAKQADTLGVAMAPPPTTAMTPDHPLSQCPFTGKKVSIELEDPADPAGRWMIKGEKYIIYGFQTKRCAEHFFSTRNGHSPNFSKLDVEVTRAEGDLPPDMDSENVFENTSHDEAEAASDTLVDAGIGKRKNPDEIVEPQG